MRSRRGSTSSACAWPLMVRAIFLVIQGRKEGIRNGAEIKGEGRRVLGQGFGEALRNWGIEVDWRTCGAVEAFADRGGSARSEGAGPPLGPTLGSPRKPVRTAPLSGGDAQRL